MTMYIGDYDEGYATLNFKFITMTAAEVPTTFAGTPAVRVYEGSATGTEINTGVTLAVDFDGVTGLNNVLIDLSAAAFYAVGADYSVVVTQGTVNGVSWVGRVLAQFSIDNRKHTEAVSGTAAISTTAVASPGGFVITAGANEANNEDSTHALDGTTHDLEDDTGDTDAYYIFDVGGNGVPVSVTWWGFAQSQGDSYTIYAYNWGGTAWEQIGTVAGTALAAVGEPVTFDLTKAHVGTGANLGLVHFRFLSADGTKFGTDRLLCSYSVVTTSVGYANGAVWVDTVNGTAGTESFVNGTADNAVLTWANALTIAANVGLERFEIVNGSTITLNANSDNYTLNGEAWTLVLGTQSCSGTSFAGATAVSGVCTGASPPQFHRCMFNSATVPPCYCYECGFNGTLTFGSAGEFNFNNCHSMVGGTSAPVFDFGSSNNASEVNMRAYSGGVDIRNMGKGTGSYNMSLEGWGQLIVNANCSATSTIAIRGHFPISGDATAIAAITFSDDARFDSGNVVLAAGGLDLISVVEMTGLATTWPQMVQSLYQATYYMSDMSDTELKRYKADGVTVISTQTLSDAAGVQTQGKAS